MADPAPMTERERQLTAQIEKLQTERLQMHSDLEAAKARRDLLQANLDFVVNQMRAMLNPQVTKEMNTKSN
jgi:outer membrane murein-binding lipoprotein Lpp